MSTLASDALFAGVNENCRITPVTPEFQESDQLGLLTCRGLSNEEDAETALLFLCGELTGLTVDRELFRTVIPPGAAGACAAGLIGEMPSADPGFRTWQARFVSREAAEEPLSAPGLLAGKLPLPGWFRVTGEMLRAPVTVASLRVQERRRILQPEKGLPAGADVCLLLLTAACVLQTP